MLSRAEAGSYQSQEHLSGAAHRRRVLPVTTMVMSAADEVSLSPPGRCGRGANWEMRL